MQSGKPVIPVCFKLHGLSLKWIPAFAGMTLFIIVSCFSIPSAFANILGNGDFSQPLGNGTESNWQQNFDNPCTGADPAGWPAACTFLPERVVLGGTNALHLKAYYSTPLPVPNFYRNSYTFQLNGSVKPGDLVTFSTQARADIKAADPGSGAIAIEFKDAADVKISEVITSGIRINTAPMAAWTTFSAQGIAPAGTKNIVFVFKADGISGGSGTFGNVYFSNANAEVNPAKLTVRASKTNVAPGDAVGVNASFTNASGVDLTGVELRATVPRGFDYVKIRYA